MSSINKELEIAINTIISDEYRNIAIKAIDAVITYEGLAMKATANNNDDKISIATIHNHIVNKLSKLLILTEQQLTSKIERIFDIDNIKEVKNKSF